VLLARWDEWRHGRKTSANGFDGYKGHVAIDPDSEIITATTVSAGNTGDDASAGDLLAGDLPAPAPEADADADHADRDEAGDADDATDGDEAAGSLAVYGDAAYGAGALLSTWRQPAPP
jgi:hypothetical protein